MSDGTRVIQDEQGAAGNAEHLTLPGVKLSVVEGPDRGAEISVRRGTARIGTSDECDLVLTDSAVSRQHAEIRLRGREVRVVDLASTNGTNVDGVQVIEAILPEASLLKVGDSAIRVIPVDEPIVVPLSSRKSFGRLLGRSVAMREAFAILERVAPSEASVLVTGETGTGKELAAEAVHTHSPRSDGPFVAVDCGAIAANLVESELFGHVKGAFTGAMGDRRGVFEEANGGTLFLDEVGELPLDLQPKLLRVLEKREVRRVGESVARKIDVRLVAATNRDLATEVNRGTFREDLYFRLAVVEVRLPPLRARREDIPTLVRHFLQTFAPDDPSRASPELLRALSQKPWPGNVRELRNAVERAVALTQSQPTGEAPADERRSMLPTGVENLLQLPIKEALEQIKERFEREYLEHALERSGGSVSGAARIAGVNRRYIQRVMQRHNLRDQDAEET